jgi:hypothetical protein
MHGARCQTRPPSHWHWQRRRQGAAVRRSAQVPDGATGSGARTRWAHQNGNWAWLIRLLYCNFVYPDLILLTVGLSKGVYFFFLNELIVLLSLTYVSGKKFFKMKTEQNACEVGVRGRGMVSEHPSSIIPSENFGMARSIFWWWIWRERRRCFLVGSNIWRQKEIGVSCGCS